MWILVPTMTKSRRSLLRNLGCGGSVLFTAAISGCFSNGEDSTEIDPGGSSLANPVMEGVETPSPEITWTNKEETEDGTDQYKIEMINQGIAGNILVELYWVNEEVEDGGQNGDGMDESEYQLVDAEQLFFDEEEFKNLVFTEDRPVEFDGFSFLVAPITVNVTVVNNGGSGDVSVTLYEQGEEFDKSILSLGSDETDTVVFERENVTSSDEFNVSTEPVDN